MSPFLYTIPFSGLSSSALYLIYSSKYFHSLIGLIFARLPYRNNGNSDRLYFEGFQNHCQMITAAVKLKDACSLEESYDQPRQYIQRRRWQPTPVLLPGKSHGRRSLVGCSPWGLKESDTTEQLHFHFPLH